MSSDHASFTQGLVKQLKVRLLEQALGRTFRVGAVRNDHVELVLALLEELEAIANVHLDGRVLEPDAHARQVLLGHADDGLKN